MSNLVRFKNVEEVRPLPGPHTLVNMRSATGSTLRIFESSGLEWGLRMCISNNFQGDTDALSLRTIGIDQPLKKFGCEERKSMQ